jgi:hypothetical protein
VIQDGWALITKGMEEHRGNLFPKEAANNLAKNASTGHRPVPTQPGQAFAYTLNF